MQVTCGDLSPMQYCINKLRDIMIVRKRLVQLNIPTRKWWDKIIMGSLFMLAPIQDREY